MNFYTAAQMKAMDKYAVEHGTPGTVLMENAGDAVVRVLRLFVCELGNKSVLVLSGTGNNGGDGFVAARLLKQFCKSIAVAVPLGLPKSAEAAEMYRKLSGITIIEDYNETLEEAEKSDIVIDAVYGTGFNGALTDKMRELFSKINRMNNVVVISIDVPSGVCADSGNVDCAVRADYTISLVALKYCHYLFPASEYCGHVTIADIKMPQEAISSQTCASFLSDQLFVDGKIPFRRRNTHKGTYGTLACVCGSYGMTGAAYMSVCAAVRTGAGLVVLFVPDCIHDVLSVKLTEPILKKYPSADETSRYSYIYDISKECNKGNGCLIGCGLGRSADSKFLVEQLVESCLCPIVLDADGIYAIRHRKDLIKNRRNSTVVTPHPGEMAMLLGITVNEVESNRIDIARSFSREYNCTLVLKGAYTVISSPSGEIYINPTGNPGLSKGGSGDVLAGIISSLIVQGLEPFYAAVCGVYIHGAVGDMCADKISEYGMTASDLLHYLPRYLRRYNADMCKTRSLLTHPDAKREEVDKDI